LVSANFLASDFILQQEIPALLQRRQQEGLIIFPVIAKACAWRTVNWLANMQVRPRNGQPVWSGSDSQVDTNLASLAEEVAQLFQPDSLAGVPAAATSPTSTPSVPPPAPAPSVPQAGVNISIGSMGGDLSGSLTGGDIVGGDKVIHHHYHSVEPEAEEKPPLPYEPETVLIPAGPFVMGSQPGEDVLANETPQHEVNLQAYRIGLYPVTNEQYAEFIKQTKHPPPKKTGWFGKTPPQNKHEHPVVRVSWYDAWIYCRWLSEQTGRTYRLPTEAEWEKAARGDDGRLYPWGNAWAPGCCNGANTETTPVTAFPTGQSPYGCHDMLGNVWEWTSTLWGVDWQESDFPYPYQPDDGREEMTTDVTVHRVFRGGGFADEISQLGCSARRWYAPDHAGRACGFRVVLEVQA
jgi:formylglycine-generating enzyme required for sulfatase activity